jgi:hypothetical protein
MDEETLFSHKELWTSEKEQHSASSLSGLSSAESHVYQSLKQNLWGHHVRLEQERISWETVMRAIAFALN